MIKFLLMSAFCLYNLNCRAQDTSAYINDVKSLYTSIQKLPSYKAQIIGDKQVGYEQLYQHLLLEKPAGRFNYFYKLAQLIVPLKDNHLYLSQMPAPITDVADLEYPKVDIDFKDLQKRLGKKVKNNIEGIYYYGKDAITAGIYRTAKKDSLIGVVLATKLPNWAVGQVILILKEYAPNRFRAYAPSIDKKAFGLLRNEKYAHHMLTETKWKKFPAEIDYVNINYGTPVYQFKTLAENIKYLRLGTFASNDEQVARSQIFFDSMKDSLTSKTIIVDIRNNGGGGYKSSAKFLNMLQRYAMNGGKIFLMINNRTVSDAEQFTVRLKGFDNVKLLGENTNGMIAYGNNYGNVDMLWSKQIKLYITDLPDQRNYVQYEDVGIKPDVYLNPKRDWISQVLEYIQKN